MAGAEPVEQGFPRRIGELAVEQRLAEADLLVGEAARDPVTRYDPLGDRQQPDEPAERGRVALLPDKDEERALRRPDVLDQRQRESRIEKDVGVEGLGREAGPGLLVAEQRAQVRLLDGEARGQARRFVVRRLGNEHVGQRHIFLDGPVP